LADRRGRLFGLRGTVVVLAIGGLLTAFSWDLASLTVFRFICGCGMGAVLALATAYVGELAPKKMRGRFLTTIYLMQAVLLTAIGFGSLPVLALGDDGWRILIGFGALVIFVLPALGKVVPESPRWLATDGQFDKAEQILARLVARGYKGRSVPAEIEEAPVEETLSESRTPLRQLLQKPLVGRLILISSFWFFFYVGFYSFSSYQPLLLTGLGVEPTQAIWLTVLGRSSGILSCILLLGVIERFERRTIVIVSACAIILSFLLLISGLGDASFVVANLLFTFALGIMVPPAFTYTSEIFPTRTRGTASAIGDGVGHLGGAVAPFVVLPILASFGAVWAMVALIVALLVAVISVAFGPRTRDRGLTEIAK